MLEGPSSGSRFVTSCFDGIDAGRCGHVKACIHHILLHACIHAHALNCISDMQAASCPSKKEKIFRASKHLISRHPWATALVGDSRLSGNSGQPFWEGIDSFLAREQTGKFFGRDLMGNFFGTDSFSARRADGQFFRKGANPDIILAREVTDNIFGETANGQLLGGR